MLAFDRTGSGIPLVLVHAFPMSRRMWQANQSVFSRNFQSISIDLPGFGDSPLQGNVSTMEKMADEVLAILDHLKISERAIFAGVSMGGYVLFQIFKRAPERVRALALISTRAGADTPEGRARRLKTVEMIEKEGLDPFAEKTLPNLLGKTTVAGNPALVADVKTQIKDASAAGVCAALRGMAERPDSTSLLPTIKVPSLVIAGEEDTFIPPAEMETMSKGLISSEFHLIPKAGHLLNMEQPAAFHEIFAHFLKRRVL